MSEEKKVVNAVVKQEKLEDIIAYLRSVPVTDPISAICAPIVHALADRIEAAWKLQMSHSWHHREMTELVMRHEKEVMELKKHIPKPDPDWKAICEKCHDGDIEPDCEYYGEPNGCNSPIYGEHPKASLGNTAATREAIIAIKDINDRRPHDADGYEINDIINAALSAPPRNCDVGTAEEQYARWRRFCDRQKCCNNQCPIYKLAIVCESKTRCNLIWAQMPPTRKERRMKSLNDIVADLRSKDDLKSKARELAKGKHILDVTCSNRSIWFDKECPIALYTDKRKCVETVVFANGTKHQDCVVSPDLVCDFTDLPFDDNTFELVVFDPPHAVDIKGTSWTYKRYGSLDSTTWRNVIKNGVSECLRVLKPYGTLIFKWSDCHIPTSHVIEAIGVSPLFGHRSGKKMNTHWMVFMKKGGAE